MTFTRNPKQTNFSADGEDFPLFFGDWLKHRRKELDFTQAELAERACCSVFALRKIEAGDRRPSKQLAGMLAKALEIPPNSHPIFVKVARGELSIEKFVSLLSTSHLAEKPNPVPETLPRALTPFIGREPELTALANLLQDPQCSLLTIVGPGGIGKTRLAIESVQHSDGRFPDGIWFVPLVSVNSPVLIIPAIADAVGFKFQDPTENQAQLLRYLSPKKALLVLDNAEHLLDGVGVITEILKECRHIKLMVTSRERLNLMSEWVFDIQGLPVPPDDQVRQFEVFSSVALFLQSARRVQAGFEIRSEERQWVHKICRIMEGMPLGIELSAAWIGLLSIKEIAIEIEHNLDFLSVSMRDLPERHRSLHATLDHSWKLLNAEEKLILSRLSVFHGSFSRQAAEAICGANLGVLSSLKNKSLLNKTDGNQYSLHEIVRQYASLKLDEYPGENERTKDQHALYFVRYLADCEKALQSAWQVETFDEMAKVIDNLSQGWQHMVTHCLCGTGKSSPLPSDLLHSALFSISLFYETRCRSMEAIGLFKESVEYLKSVQDKFNDTQESSCFKSFLGHVTAYLGLHHTYILQYEKSIEYLEEALGLLEDEQSKVFRAQTKVMLAATRDIHGQLQESAALLKQCREVFREAGENWWYALSTINLAYSNLTTGKYDESEALFQEAFRLVTHGDMRLELPLRNGYAVLHFFQNDFSKVEQILLENLEYSYRAGSRRQTAFILSYLGRVALATHQDELALTYHQQGISILQEFGESHDLALACIHLGKCYAARSERNAAQTQFRKAIRIGEAINKFHLVVYGLVNIALVYLADGQTGKALELFILLERCPVEYIRIKNDLNQLHADLQATLQESEMEAVLQQANSKVPIEKARAAVLEYVHEHEAV